MCCCCCCCCCRQDLITEIQVYRRMNTIIHRLTAVASDLERTIGGAVRCCLFFTTATSPKSNERMDGAVTRSFSPDCGNVSSLRFGRAGDVVWKDDTSSQHVYSIITIPEGSEATIHYLFRAHFCTGVPPRMRIG